MRSPYQPGRGFVVTENDLCFLLSRNHISVLRGYRNMNCFENGTLSVIYMINYDDVSGKF